MISSFDAAIGVFNVVKDTVEIIPAKGVFGSVATILGLVRVSEMFYCASSLPPTRIHR